MPGLHDEGHKLFVGDLPPDVTKEELHTVFSTYGLVTNIHLMHPHPRSGQRCALVFYDKVESAEDAIKVLNGIYKIREDAPNPIKVAWAKEKHMMGGPGGGPMHTMDADGYKLFVGGLPTDCKEEELRMVFTTYGEVNKIHVMPPHAQSGRVAAFVFYSKAESAEDAISVLDGQYKIRQDADQPIQVKWAQSKGGGKGGFDAWGGCGGGGDWGAYGQQGGGDWNAWGGGGPLGGPGGKGGWGGGPQGMAEPAKPRNQDGWKLFVGGLPRDCSEEELHTVFSTYGEVRKVHVMAPHQVSGRVAAFVFYSSEQAAEDAIKVLNGIYKIREDAEAPIQVRWASDKPAGKGDGCKGGSSYSGGCGKGDAWGGWGPGLGGKCGGGKGAIGWQDSCGAGYGAGCGGWQDPSMGGQWGGNWQDNSGAGWGNPAWGNDGGYGKGGKKGDGKWQGDQKGFGKGGKTGEVSETKLFVGNLPEDVTEDALQYVFGTYGKVQQVHIMTGKSRTGAACAFVEFALPSDAETAILTLHDKYEIKPGCGPILVKKANAGNRSRPY